jgi:hypothetical protein
MLRRATRLGLTAAVLVLVAAACDPITHPTFTVKEGPSSAVTAEKVSGNGNFVIVRATAAGATVPGAGLWRVDRRDGSAVRLPDGYTVQSISRTGARVLLRDLNSNRLIWSGGTLITPPGGLTTAISADVTFGLFLDAAGAVKRWDVATGAITPVETGLPRPPNRTVAYPNSISNDGRIAQYSLTNPCCSGGIWRVVDIASHTATDVPDTSGGDVTDSLNLAPGNGSALLLHHEESYVDYTQEPPVVVKIADWVELRDRASGAVRHHYEVPDNRFVLRLNIAANGTNAWVMQVHSSECSFGGPTHDLCVDASEAVVLFQGGRRSFSTGGGHYLDSFSVTPSGRFLAYNFVYFDQRFPYGPTIIIDWLTGTVEHLLGSVDYWLDYPYFCSLIGKPNPCLVPGVGVKGNLSDDGVLAVTSSSSGTGWYEYTPAPE